MRQSMVAVFFMTMPKLIHQRVIEFLTHGSHILVYGAVLHLGVNLSGFDVGMTEHF